MNESTPVIDAEIKPVSVSEPKTQDNTKSETPVSAPKPSPAQDLRDIQNLLVSGIFPGNLAPAVVRAYQLLEAMAKGVEADAPKE